MLSAPSAASRTFRRRDALTGAARGILGLALITATASACGSDKPPEVDPLQAQLDLADADSQLAKTAATAAAPALVPPLTQVASERAQHARALAEEIARAANSPAPTTEPTGSTGATPTTSANTAPPPSVADVVTALRASAASAAQLAAIESGYRAGLLGSIAASCTASFTVGLDIPTPAP